MGALSDCRAVLPTVVLDHWRRTSGERLGKVLAGGMLLFLGVLLFVGAAATFELEDDLLRRHTLNLLAAIAVLCWFVGAVVVRFEMSGIFDFRRLLVLPISFRTFYAMRVGAGLTGFWVPVFAPSLLFLLSRQTVGLSGFAVALLAMAALVILLGRLVGIVLLKLDDLNASWMTTVAFLVLAVVALFAVEPVMKDRALDLTDQPVINLIADQVRESRVLAAAGYLPGGLLAGIFDVPGDRAGNVMRLAALWLAAVLAMALEYRILRRGRALLPAGSHEAGGVHFPLARLLRRRKRLAPSTCLTVVEVESSMRLKWFRGLALPGVLLAPVLQTGALYSLIWVLVVTGSLLALRDNAYGIAHRSVRDRFSLPVPLVDFAVAHVRAMTLFPAIVFVTAVAWKWQRMGWPGLDVFVVWLALPIGLLVGGLGFGVFSSVRWPHAFDMKPSSTSFRTGLELLAMVAFTSCALGGPFLLEYLARNVSWGPHAAIAGAGALVVGAAAFMVVGRRAGERLLRSNPHRILDLLAGRQEEEEPRQPGLTA